MHPGWCIPYIGSFLDICSEVKRLTGNEVNTKRHVVFIGANATEIDGHCVDEVVDNRTKANKISKEERQGFNTIPFIEGREFKTC